MLCAARMLFFVLFFVSSTVRVPSSEERPAAAAAAAARYQIESQGRRVPFRIPYRGQGLRAAFGASMEARRRQEQRDAHDGRVRKERGINKRARVKINARDENVIKVRVPFARHVSPYIPTFA